MSPNHRRCLYALWIVLLLGLMSVMPAIAQQAPANRGPALVSFPLPSQSPAYAANADVTSTDQGLQPPEVFAAAGSQVVWHNQIGQPIRLSSQPFADEMPIRLYVPRVMALGGTQGTPASASIAAGENHTCALTTAGGVKCWGRNSEGELGDGSGGNEGDLHLTPVDVEGLQGGVAAIAAGGFHTCVLTSAGGVKCWGWNHRGQLGDGSGGDLEDLRLTPVDVEGLQSGGAAIATGWLHTCALTFAGGVKCWGDNSWGQSGGGTTNSFSLTPVDVDGLQSSVTAIAAGADHTCALTTAGGVKCWGMNLYGQLGDGTTNSFSQTPVDVVGLQSGSAAIAAGQEHTCALTSAGGVKCWGMNYYGQLGDGRTDDRPTPVDVVGLQSGVKAIAAGSHHTCALTTAGGVKCWGNNEFGQLGDGSGGNLEARRLTPVDVMGLQSGGAAIAAGGDHTCTLTTTGGVKCWGDNDSGQLGDGSGGNLQDLRLTPVDVIWP